MTAIVIYGKAVQDARNRMRSAHVSTMLEVLDAFFGEGPGKGVSAQWIEQLTETIEALPQDIGKENAHLKNAKIRLTQFAGAGGYRDIFAIGDVLRELGDYLAEDEGGGKEWKAFAKGLRDEKAFAAPANRARVAVPDYDANEWPQLGVFKYRLLERSVVKYMERFYGPYIGADISGTTTDSLAVLAFLVSRILSQQDPTQELERQDALLSLDKGFELIPIASMVLQYHHSLLECMLALSLAVRSDKGLGEGSATTLGKADFYDYTSLLDRIGAGPADAIAQVLLEGNQSLQSEFGGRRLVIVRDFIDIRDNPYVDCEIALLVPADREPLFELGSQYGRFSQARQQQSLTEGKTYLKSDPSLLAIAAPHEGTLDLPIAEGGEPIALAHLVRQNSLDLKALNKASKTNFFDDLESAIAAAVEVDAPHAIDPQAAADGAPPTLPDWLTAKRLLVLQGLLNR